MTVFVFCYPFRLEVSFSKYSYIHFLFVKCLEYHLLSFHFEPICLWIWNESLVGGIYTWVLVVLFLPCSYSEPFDWWVQCIYYIQDYWYVGICCCHFIFFLLVILSPLFLFLSVSFYLCKLVSMVICSITTPLFKCFVSLL